MISTMSRCDVDLRLNVLKLLVSLTTGCPENTVLVIRMKHWHTFINETLEEYPDIELHQLSIRLLANLITSDNESVSRTFVMLCLSYTEIMHSLLSSMRRWIRSANQSKENTKTDFWEQLKLTLQFGIISISRIISCLDLAEDLKEQIFRYERRFQVFFLRMVEVICFSVNLGFEKDLCRRSIVGCFKSLFILLTEFGTNMKPLKTFFSALENDQDDDLVNESMKIGM